MSPRARSSQEPILKATLELIAEHGVDNVTVDTVAATTGVSKATLYRHWGSRAKLIHAAFAQPQRSSVEPDSGSLRDDLIGLLRQLVTYLNRRDSSSVFTSLIDAASRDPELAALHKQNEREGRAFFERVIHRGIENGELPDDVDVRLLIDVLISPFIYRRVVVLSTAKQADVVPIVDCALAAFGRVKT